MKSQLTPLMRRKKKCVKEHSKRSQVRRPATDSKDSNEPARAEQAH